MGVLEPIDCHYYANPRWREIRGLFAARLPQSEWEFVARSDLGWRWSRLTPAPDQRCTDAVLHALGEDTDPYELRSRSDQIELLVQAFLKFRCMSFQDGAVVWNCCGRSFWIARSDHFVNIMASVALQALGFRPKGHPAALRPCVRMIFEDDRVRASANFFSRKA